MTLTEIQLGDTARLRKKHACGSFDWTIVRVGVDIGLVCHGCQRRILLPRPTFVKRLKAIIPRAEQAE